MKSKKSLITLIVTVLIIVIAIIAVFLNRKDSKGEAYAIPASNAVVYDTSYQEYLNQNGYDGVVEDATLQVDLNNYTASGDMTVKKLGNGLSTGDSGSITWDLLVEKEGFYNLEVGYIPEPGTTSDIQRRLFINGEVCYNGLEQVVFKRFWKDEAINSKAGNEIRPNTIEEFIETKQFIEDYERRVGEPYMFYLKKGLNTITFEVVKEPIEFTSIIFKKAGKATDYNTAITKLREEYPVFDGANIICQAERAGGGTLKLEKNSASINIQKNYSDSRLSPYHPYKIIYNTIGGTNWKQPGDAITWEITVPKEGLYELTFKGRQSLKRGVTSCRRLLVNGELPYAEMNALNFEYSSGMINYTITDKDKNPYLFHLKEGVNTITLECVAGDFGSVINDVEDSMTQLNQMYLKVIKITGQTPDKFIDYQIAEKFPEFSETMAKESERLQTIVDQLVQITGEKGENTSLVQKMAIEARELSKEPERVVEELGQFKENISALGTWLITITEMPLELDSFIVSGEDTKLPRASDTFLEGAYYGAYRFLTSFFVKTSQVSQDASKDSATIKVWMVNSVGTNVQSIGHEQAQIIQNLIDESFTPETGIKVNLQLIPLDVVLRAALAGNAPDAVIGLSQATLQDFAMRDAIIDLSKLDGYETATKTFYKSELDAASYLGGVYGIPEQADFYMMFTRNDILKEIGLEVPKTWEEVKNMLPILKKNNYEFYLPTVKGASNFYPSLVYQYGGDLYQGKGNDYGMANALGSDAAMQSFKLYTDFFTNYGLIADADFSNRFRTGEMPIGVTKYTTFCQLEVFAPEIKGLWSFQPVPGVEKEDGSIDNQFVIETINSAILSTSKNQEKTWDFVKWWTSTDVQLKYANTVESVMGTAARYPSANPEVLKQLPWSNKELLELMSQLSNTAGIPAVPGNYMTNRMILYSFNKVLAENTNPRETLYLNLKTIDKELTNKRKEFKLSAAK
ncbi:extracellular solute-binding protein [Anaerocolumna sp. AGMB13025]|uniref:extracellular solute-binding protein n=1 Tax=Anaerocolumna sp. AGMB13025 TaxID=3039116 RepID=UPI00241EB896|nr:extracellular solute-binding protein [Anaerocolumna sp. AGMB13025]WFR58221.1 extracellular solute-binding protein [Anaerocolumna sp. AGMB13025]